MEARMTMTQQERYALQQNWDQAKGQIKAKFQGLTDDDLQDSTSVSDRIAQRTGEGRDKVEAKIREVAQQFTA